MFADILGKNGSGFPGCGCAMRVWVLDQNLFLRPGADSGVCPAEKEVRPPAGGEAQKTTGFLKGVCNETFNVGFNRFQIAHGERERGWLDRGEDWSLVANCRGRTDFEQR